MIQDQTQFVDPKWTFSFQQLGNFTDRLIFPERNKAMTMIFVSTDKEGVNFLEFGIEVNMLPNLAPDFGRD